MDHDTQKIESLGAIEFVDERRDGLFTERGIRGGEVNQVACVRHDWRDASLFDAFSKQLHLGRVKRLSAPLIRVLRKDLQRLAAVYNGTVDSFRDAASHRHMRADSKHPITIMTGCEPRLPSHYCY